MILESVTISVLVSVTLHRISYWKSLFIFSAPLRTGILGHPNAIFKIIWCKVNIWLLRVATPFKIWEWFTHLTRRMLRPLPPIYIHIYIHGWNAIIKTSAGTKQVTRSTVIHLRGRMGRSDSSGLRAETPQGLRKGGYECKSEPLIPAESSQTRNLLTQWGRDKIAAILQTIFSNAFYCNKVYEFRLRFH